MNNANARQILRCYRSDAGNAGDESFGEALRHASNDPNLGAWFRKDQEMDDALRAKLREVEVPASLKDEILAVQAFQPRQIFHHKTAHLLAWAAALLIAVGLSAALLTRSASLELSFATFPETAVALMNDRFDLELMAEDVHDAKRWMAGRGVSAALPIPPALERAATNPVGCAPLEWGGEKLLLLCFWMEDGSVVHYFVMDVQALPDAVPGAAVRVAQQGNYWTTSWADDRHAYVLASKGQPFHAGMTL